MAQNNDFEEILSTVNKHHEEAVNEDFQIRSEYSANAKRRELKPKRNYATVALIVAVVLIICIVAGIIFGVAKGKKEQPTTADNAAPSVSAGVTLGTLNPLTGEDDYNQAAIGKRPVCCVVENEYSTEAVRPQWGLSEADMVLEGESEFSTRLHLFFADYTAMPEKIGPSRSARPPFIRFSKLFDAVFIHTGLSKSKGDYIGANDVFKSEKVDHINMQEFTPDGTYLGRDRSRGGAVEHTAFVNGSNIPALLKEKGIRTELDTAHFTLLAFNGTAQPLSDKPAETVRFRWADSAAGGICPKEGVFTYDEGSHRYTTTDFDSKFGEAGVSFENLVLLLDETEYIVKSNYKGGTADQTYCDYKLKGGKGMLLSEGTCLDIQWNIDNGKLVLKDEAGNAVKLNPGKTYFALGSSNYGGSITAE